MILDGGQAMGNAMVDRNGTELIDWQRIRENWPNAGGSDFRRRPFTRLPAQSIVRPQSNESRLLFASQKPNYFLNDCSFR